MEYVANAQGQDIAVASVLKAAVQPPSVGSDAPLAAAPSAAAVQPASLSSSPMTLAEVEAFYKKVIANVEADSVALKRFAATVIANSAVVKADVVAVESLPKAVKVLIGALIGAGPVLGYVAAKFL